MKFKILIWLMMAAVAAPFLNFSSNFIFNENIPLIAGSFYWFTSICFYGGIYILLTLKGVKAWLALPLFLAISLSFIIFKNIIFYLI